MADMTTELQKVKDLYHTAKSNASTSSYWNLSTEIQRLEGTLREHIQAETKNEVQAIIHKLESGETLTAEDIEYVKLWIVGDAEQYVRLENNYKDWTDELERLMGEIMQADGDNPVYQSAAKLKAQLLDAVRVLGDIVFFIKQRDRVKNFEESTEMIDPQERDLLIMLLKGKMISPNE